MTIMKNKSNMAKSSTRKELAQAAGVSVKTINRWLASVEKELRERGYTKCTRVLNPSITQFVCNHFNIEL